MQILNFLHKYFHCCLMGLTVDSLETESKKMKFKFSSQETDFSQNCVSLQNVSICVVTFIDIIQMLNEDLIS